MIRLRVVFLKGHEGNETADHLRATFREKLKADLGMDFNDFLQHFKFVTNCASAMPCIVDASSSSSRRALSKKWMGCINHKINTEMRQVLHLERLAQDGSIGSQIKGDLDKVKLIVRIMKKTGLNQKLPSGLCLVKGVETRFGSTYDTVKRFVQAAPHVRPLISTLTKREGLSEFHGLKVNEDVDAVETFPGLEAVLIFFAELREKQDSLEASLKSTIYRLFPWLERIKQGLETLYIGIEYGSSFSTTH